MENKIIFYKLNGEISSEEFINEESLKRTNGMMIKCFMKNNEEESGFASPYNDCEKEFTDSDQDNINLWTWANLDEDKHELIGDNDSKYKVNTKKVKIKDIVYIKAILHSNPRWGGKLTNRFEYFQSRFKNNINDENNLES